MTVDVGGPRYRHDCWVVGMEDPETCEIVSDYSMSCRFVGRLRKYDLYVHPHHGVVESVARFSDDGPDYLSGPAARDLIVEFVSRGA